MMNEDITVMNEEVVSPDDDFQALRDKYSPEAARSQFKTQMVGGFNQEEVINYVIQMRDDYKKLVREMRNQINELLASKIEFEHVAEEKNNLQNDVIQVAKQREEFRKLLSEAGQEIIWLNEAAARLKKENNLMKSKIDDLGKGVSSNDSQYEELQQKNFALEETITEKMFELEEQRKINEEAAKKLKLEKSRVLSNEITSFKDEFLSIYKKMETISDEQSKINNELQGKLDEQVRASSELLQQLDDQANMHNELQQQLDAEVLRAVKAEDDKAGLMRCINQLKDSLFSEQNLLEAQLNQITERRNEISGFLTNLQ